MARRLDGLFQRADDEAAHQAAIAEAHFRLGRMHIDVDLMRVAAQKQRQRRMAPRGQIIHIGRTHGPGEELVAHEAPVDEEILRRGAGPVPGRQAGEALQDEALAHSVEA